MGDLHSSLCCYTIVVSLTNILTHILKNYCGYLRPIFYDVCQPNFSNGVATCTHDSAKVRKSFPSGHSSMSFCAMVLFTYYLHYKFGTLSSYYKNNAETRHATDYGATTLNNENVISSNYVPKSTIRQRLISSLSFLPIILALFIAGSRVHDNYHHPGEFSSKQHTKTTFLFK